MQIAHRLTPCLWFDTRAEEAARFYVSVFPNGRIGTILHYSRAGQEFHHMEEGTVLTVEFEIAGQQFMALNGGPLFTFSPAVSFIVLCDTQEEVDYYWDRLTEGGDERAQQCGWLTDKYGLSWQVVPVQWFEMLKDPDPEKVLRSMTAINSMKKLDIETLRRAHEGR